MVVARCLSPRRPLRQNVYRILDRIIATGEPVEIERWGRRLRILLADDAPAPVGKRDLGALPGLITRDETIRRHFSGAVW